MGAQTKTANRAKRCHIPLFLFAVFALFTAISLQLGCSTRAPQSEIAAKREPTAAPKPAPPPIQLSLSQMVGLRMIYGYAGYSPPERLRRIIARGEASGVILFKRNVKNSTHLAATMRALQAIRRPRGFDVPLLIMVDQEGGKVKRLPGPPMRSAAQIGRIAPWRKAKQSAFNEGIATGRSLRRLGINVNLAPVVDVARRGSHTEQSERSFGRDAQRVSTLAAAFARGMAQEKTMACWKHFPGLGSAGVNQDFQVNTLRLNSQALQKIDMQPFRAAPSHALVMTSSAIYPALDSRPAMFSARVVRTALRKTVGFKGLAVTDDLQVPSLKHYGSPTRRGLMSIRAGNDLLLYCQSLVESEIALRQLTRLAARRELNNTELRQTALRILAFRAKMKKA